MTVRFHFVYCEQNVFPEYAFYRQKAIHTTDAENEKTTYITLFGIEKSREIVNELVEESNNAIRGSILDDSFLYDLAEMLAVREY